MNETRLKEIEACRKSRSGIWVGECSSQGAELVAAIRASWSEVAELQAEIDKLKSEAKVRVTTYVIEGE